VRGWIGQMGSGKTYCAVMDCYARRKANPELPVMTNLSRLDLPGVPVQFLSVDDGLDVMFGQMRDFREGIMLLDEVGIFLPSRMWAKVPLELSAKWAQLRKDGVDLMWTAIWVGSVVKDLREITMETTICTSWQRFGWFFMRTYSSTRVESKKFYQGMHIRIFRPGLAGRLYDTMGKVKAPDWAGRSRLGPPAIQPAVDVPPGGVSTELEIPSLGL
jgi:hypothetical protein